ncbi:hypothetical protein D3C79_679860 [compost metagenome]
MHRVGGNFVWVEVEHLGQDLEGEARRQAVHAFVDTRRVPVFLDRLGLWIGVLEVFPVVNAHLGIDIGVLWLFQAGKHRELSQHLERIWRTVGLGQRAVDQQFVVDLYFIADPQAVRHLDDIDPVDERFVVLVVTEGVPLRFVGVRQQNPGIGNRPKAFSTVVVAFLGGGEQGVQDLDRRLEHFDEFHQALVGPAQRARVAISIGVVLWVFLKFADIDLADQGRDVLVVFIAGFGLGNGDLVKNRRVQLHHLELGDVPAKLLQALGGPRRHDGIEVAPWDAELFLENGPIFGGIEQAQR